ncbi:hypothetical protein [uncultured Ruegeria sp.]|uniref:hypothetical protein n=1 Tax=uncultured Ruegeria sp. TaxID=259304 RepID=UPI00262F2773|nr:hypothetical protein [uncultured Ruegeria sp.]
MIANPVTGQMTDRGLLKNHHLQNNSQGGAAVRMAGHGATLGLSDEAAYLGGRVAAGPEGGVFARENERAKIDANRQDFPVTSLVSEMAGGLAVPASVLSNSGKAATLGQAAKQGASAGAVTGGAYAAAEGEGFNNRLTRLPGGLIGGAAGGAVAVPVAKVVGWAAQKVGKPVARLFRDRRYYTEGRVQGRRRCWGVCARKRG